MPDMARKKKIKAIIFDLGGVVVHGGYLDFLRHFCARCMSGEGKRQVAWLERQANLGNLTETQFLKLMRKAFGLHLSIPRMHDLIVSHMRTDKGLVKLIPKLKRSKIALFSNSLGNMAVDVLRKRHLNSHRLFKRVFISSRLHLAKPDKKAYQFILLKLRVKPSQALMVDDRKVNVKGARKLGMQGIVYKNSAQFRRAIKKYDFV